MINTKMEQVNLIRPVSLYKGPDAIRGTGEAFIVTAYPDDNGKRFLPGQVA